LAKSPSKSQQNYSALYKSSNRWQSNRKRKLLKQLKLQPDNEQIKLALENIKYRRKTPKTQEWSKTDIQIAKLFKEICGYVDTNIFSSNPKVQASALAAHKSKKQTKEITGKVSFTLGARAHDGRGNLIWG
jgi:hypothetical protein